MHATASNLWKQVEKTGKFEKLDAVESEALPGDILVETDGDGMAAMVVSSSNGSNLQLSNTAFANNGGAFSNRGVEWVDDTVALQKYGYKSFENPPAPESMCPICHPGSGDGWNCIGFAWASWHHGGGIESTCNNYVIDNNGGDALLNMSVEEGSAYASEKVGVPCTIIKNGGAGIPESMLQPGDVMFMYSGGTYYHTAVYLGENRYGESSHPGALVSNDGVYSSVESDVKLAIRYAGAGGGGAASFSKKDTMTVLQEIDSSSGSRISIGYIDGTDANCAQSFAYCNGKYAVAFATSDQAPSYVQTYDTSGSQLSFARADSIGHANGACVTSNGDLMVAGAMNPDSSTGYTFSVAGDVKKTGEKALPSNASAIAYDRQTGKYILATGSTIRIYNAEMTKEENSVARSFHGRYYQDVGAGYGFVFACHTEEKGRENSGSNFIDIYNEETGDYCGSYHLSYGELESCDIVNGELVLLVHILGYENYIQNTGIMIDNSGSGYTSEVFTKLDMDIIAAYNVSISNTSMWLDDKEALKEGDTNGWLDDQAYRDITGKKLKLYWFGENRGQINYTKDFKSKIDKLIKGRPQATNASSGGAKTIEIDKPDASKWYLLLVNSSNEIPDGYDPDLKKISRNYTTYKNAKVDSRIYDSLMEMIEDCEAAGNSPLICSAYRTRKEQEELYDKTANKTDTAVPGTSEHECGLAVDIVDSDYQTLDDAQADTATQQWLMENCQNYGFILRYPKGKQSMTGIVYEPWHYRYVGKKAAKEIKSYGCTLEEYLSGTIYVSGDDSDDTETSDEVQIKINDSALNAKSACIYRINDDGTGTFIYEKNADEKRAQASTTKLMTAALLIESGKLDDSTTISSNVAATPSSYGNLVKVDSWNNHDLMHAMMLPSANDAAAAIAEGVSGDTASFVKKMNAKAKDLGMNDTVYKNPHGLDQDGHYSTARDVARLTAYAYTFPEIRESWLLDTKDITSKKKGITWTLETTDQLLGYDSNFKGGKTGTQDNSGYCFAGVYEYNGDTYVTVVLGCDTEDDRWEDTKLLHSCISDGDSSTERHFFKIIIGDTPEKVGDTTILPVTIKECDVEDIMEPLLGLEPNEYYANSMGEQAARASSGKKKESSAENDAGSLKKRGTGSATNLEAALSISDVTGHTIFGDLTPVEQGAGYTQGSAVYGAGSLPLPLKPGVFSITSEFTNGQIRSDVDTGRSHDGLDLGAPTGTPIYASLPGEVTKAEYYGAYGNCVIIKSGNYEIIYGHMSRIQCAQGDRVSQGQIIGLVGSTGMSTGPHLHFEVRLNGKLVDPKPLLGL